MLSSGSVCTSDTTPVLHGCVAQVTQVRLAAIPEIDPRLKCKTVKLYGFYFQAIDSKWDIFGNRKILRFPIFLRQEIESRKSRVSIRSRAAAKQADQRSPRDRFLSCGVSPGGRFRKLTHYLKPSWSLPPRGVVKHPNAAARPSGRRSIVQVPDRMRRASLPTPFSRPHLRCYPPASSPRNPAGLRSITHRNC